MAFMSGNYHMCTHIMSIRKYDYTHQPEIKPIIREHLRKYDLTYQSLRNSIYTYIYTLYIYIDRRSGRDVYHQKDSE